MTKFQITQIKQAPGYIDLGIGNPDLSLLPLAALQQSADMFFAKEDPRSLQYATEQGSGYFRSALANFLSFAYKIPVDSKHLFITGGITSALDLFCTFYTRYGEVVFAEEPTYFLALRIFKDHGLKVVPISMDENGMCLEKLDELLSLHRPKFIYTIPSFQNPSGRTLIQKRREKLVERAQHYNILLLADEVYQLLPYSQTPPAPFANYARDMEQVISLNSFSKILAPGLRLGWIQAHDNVIKRLTSSGLLESGGGINPFTSSLVQGLIESGELEQNISHLRNEYTLRLKVMDAALRQYLPKAEYVLPKGGFFFWLRLPGVDTEKMRQKAKRYKVDFREGALFSCRRQMQDYLRISFCYYSKEKIKEGIKRIAACLNG